MVDENCPYCDSVDHNNKNGWQRIYVCSVETGDWKDINMNNHFKCNAEDYQACEFYLKKNKLKKRIDE